MKKFNVLPNIYQNENLTATRKDDLISSYKIKNLISLLISFFIIKKRNNYPLKELKNNIEIDVYN